MMEGAPHPPDKSHTEMNTNHLLLGTVSLIPFVSCTSMDRNSGDHAITRIIIGGNHNPRHVSDTGLISGDHAVTEDVISVTPSGLSNRR